ncbi:HigA family addiction module antidote protein [Pseudaminobacter sp. 19-2017]|uniref:HigA family addiction module antidote protein n=1 Tax=Pseudaminobacter soli (ex Zhang et al. 2022) TaxID=2831468 RepID=A0A942E674_9HYPH|nr:HigA family addiction module antitoxin [Pseudaminobacter soli]MBS3651863.1 HigA family addiction module antidote protein [Pseudaminobacter soli]
MATATKKPDYIVSPGAILDEILEERGIPKQAFAERCGRSPKFVSEVIAGKAPVTEETALQFGRVLNMEPQVWVNLESNYRLRLAEQEEERRFARQVAWAKAFPVKDMVQHGLLDKPGSPAETVRNILAFFRCASVESFNEMVAARQGAVAYRRSPSFVGHPQAVMAWLQWGERIAEGMDCRTYDPVKFRACLKEARRLTMSGPEEIQSTLGQICADAGVALVLAPELAGTKLSGAARWVGDRPLLQLSLRHKSDDHFWFTFFHEAGHILLHGKKGMFIDEDKAAADDPKEAEANEFAASSLIPKHVWKSFAVRRRFDEGSIRKFSEECGIAPGIVVGRLQHERILPFNTRLNCLKQRFEWSN